MTPGSAPPGRRAVVARLAAAVAARRPGGFVRVAVDGVDGVGKTTFADELGAAVGRLGRPVVRASADGFHNPRRVRYRLARDSPEGFYRDSYDLGALRRHLLEPLGPGGSGAYRPAVFDHRRDAPVERAEHLAPPGAALVLDGLFLHRPELRGCWDVSVFLDAPFAVTVPRGAARGPGWGSPDPGAASNRRYVEGQRLYLREARPWGRAHVVLDNTDLDAPRILAWRL